MTYFSDLSQYTYGLSFYGRPGTKNIGWLDNNHEFIRRPPTEKMLDRIWEYCKISVAQTRGVHECELCSTDSSYRAERNGEKLLLGTSEIRVFAKNGDIFAAPTLIYHYVHAHHYKPPDEFIQALTDGILPSDKAYFERLQDLDLEWRKTSVPELRRQR